MNWYSIFYLMSVADGVSTFAVWIAVIATITFLITSLLKMPADSGDRMNDTQKKNNSRLWITSLLLMIFFWFTFILIPSRKDMILIVAGGSVGQFIANDENAQKLPSEVFQYLRKEVLEATADLDIDVANAVKKELGVESAKDKLMKKSKEELIELLESNGDETTN